MERAIWKDRFYYASEISESYEGEKSIRKASARKELVCPDPDCAKPVLRYCHGEVNGAYFAHLDNCDCDYANFDKNNKQWMRRVKRSIYDSFISQGYDVKIEIKVLPRHYTHLLFTLQNGKKVALELGTQKTTAKEMSKLCEEYKKLGIAVKWIIVGDANTAVKENKTFFSKRYSLNENKYKDALLVNWEGTEILQYVVDPNKYVFSGHGIAIGNYSDIYPETGALTDLTFEEDELTLRGFYGRYREWLKKKQKAFENQVEKIKKELIEQENRRKQLKQEIEEREKHTPQYQKECERPKTKEPAYNLRASNMPIVPKDNLDRLEFMRAQLENGTDLVYDESGYSLRLCRHCNMVKRALVFCPDVYYEKSPNLGLCKMCKKNNVPKK